MNLFLAAICAFAISDHAKPPAAGHAPASHGPAQAALSPDKALASIVEGNRRYVNLKLKHPGLTFARRTELGKGQQPPVMVLSCADSRVTPELVFDQGPGDLFVVRVAGNIADTDELASLEYAASHLGSKLLVVLGHERCGAVKAAVETYQSKAHGSSDAKHEESDDEHGSVPALVGKILPSVEDAATGKPGDLVDASVKANVRHTIATISSRSPILRKMINLNEIKIIGGVVDLDSGKVEWLQSGSINYVRVSR